MTIVRRFKSPGGCCHLSNHFFCGFSIRCFKTQRQREITTELTCTSTNACLELVIQRLTSDILNLLDRSLIAFHGVELVDVGIEFWVVGRVDLLEHPLTCLEREGHQDVGCGELFAAEKLAAIGGTGELRFQEVEVGLVVRLEIETVDLSHYGFGQGTNEERDFVAFEDCAPCE